MANTQLMLALDSANLKWASQTAQTSIYLTSAEVADLSQKHPEPV